MNLCQLIVRLKKISYKTSHKESLFGLIITRDWVILASVSDPQFFDNVIFIEIKNNAGIYILKNNPPPCTGGGKRIEKFKK